MKKNLLYILISSVICLASCKEKQIDHLRSKGSLTFDDVQIELKVDVSTKAGGDTDEFHVFIYDSQSAAVVAKTWGEIKAEGKEILLDAGDYSIVVRSQEEEVPAAVWEHPVYSYVGSFMIEAGKTTNLGTLECSLAQTKVTVDYNEEFLSSITGDSKVSVYFDENHALDYVIKSDKTIETRAGYFAASKTVPQTMVVKFSGSFDGKPSKMTKAFESILAGQWHKITFAKKEADEGNATISIEIDDLLADADLGTDAPGTESIIGPDPNAPTGDGGIEAVSTCSYDINQPIVIPENGNPFVLTLDIKVPNKVNKFTVDIQSTNPLFTDSVKMINDDSTVLDLVNPTEGAMAVFTDILPFPYGDAVKGQELIHFDLSDAQVPINAFDGTHSFVLTVIDKKGCRKDINMALVVPSI